MKVGVGNRLDGAVTLIKCGTVMCLVKVRLAGGAEMESVMTRVSFDGLGIQEGDRSVGGQRPECRALEAMRKSTLSGSSSSPAAGTGA